MIYLSKTSVGSSSLTMWKYFKPKMSQYFTCTILHVYILLLKSNPSIILEKCYLQILNVNRKWIMDSIFPHLYTIEMTNSHKIAGLENAWNFHLCSSVISRV